MGYRVLVVDDEELTRKGIINKVSWSSFDVESVDEASDGEEALDRIRKGRPDIVITDIKMPELDGLSLIKKVTEDGCRAKFIIISAYSEFEYAKSAMSYGIRNYVLKPIDAEILEQIILDTVKEIQMEASRNEQLDSYRQQMLLKQKIKRELLLTELFLDNNSEALINTVLRENHISFAYPCFFVATVALNLHELLKANEDQLIAQCGNIIQKATEPYGNILFFRNVYSMNEYILIFNISEKKDAGYYRETVVKSILNELSKQLRIQVFAGISLVVRLLINITKAYNQSKSAASEAILRGGNGIFEFSDFINEGLVVKEIENSKHVLFAFILNGRKGAAISYIQDIFTGGNHPILNHIHLRIFCTEVLIELEKLMRKNNLDMEQIVTEKYNFVNHVTVTGNIRQMMLSLQEIVVQVADILPRDKRNVSHNLVTEVIDYINDNYNEEISLRRIADMYYINPNYFCKIFKDVTNLNFNMYVTKVRLEKATHFLKVTNLTINEVAGMVGFHPKYFCKVFKNELKMTPKEYMLRKTEQEADGIDSQG